MLKKVLQGTELRALSHSDSYELFIIGLICDSPIIMSELCQEWGCLWKTGFSFHSVVHTDDLQVDDGWYDCESDGTDESLVVEGWKKGLLG